MNFKSTINNLTKQIQRKKHLSSNDKYHDYVYLDLLQSVLSDGITKQDRTGTGTKSSFGQVMEFDLSDGTIPLLTTKKMHTKSIIYELLWFLSGSTNVADLQKNGIRIWNEWIGEDGTIGKGYGHQWRHWDTYTEIEEELGGLVHCTKSSIDQIQTLIDDIKNNPNSRRLIVNAWNVGEIDSMKLPPCHFCFQMYVANNKLSMQLQIRSNDLFLGNPFNIAQYAILLHMLAQVCDKYPGKLRVVIGDAHIYSNHIEQCLTQLQRIPFKSPKLKLNEDITNIFDFKFEDFEIVGYKSHPTIKGIVAI